MSARQPSVLEFPYDGPPSPGAAREIVNGLSWIRMPLPFALDHINLWLLREPDGFSLVDCGYGDAPTRALWERHFETTFAGRPLVRIVATHYHPDHLGNAAWLEAKFGCPVTMTLAEFLTGQAIHAMSPGYGFADVVQLFSVHGMEPAHVAAFDARGNHYAKGAPELPASIRRILDGESLSLGGRTWRVIEGFGHSPEHASLYSPEAALLISGDMLLPRISTNVSVWASEPEGDPLGRFLDSLTAFEALPRDTLVLPSHGLPFRGIHARVEALRTHHDERLAEVLKAVHDAGGDVCAAEIVPLLFRRPLDLQQRFFAIGEAIAHLNHLWHKGALARSAAKGPKIRFALPAGVRDG